MVTRSICGVVRCSMTNRLIVRVLQARRSLTIRHLNTGSSSSVVLPAVNIIQAKFSPDRKPLPVDWTSPRDVLVRAQTCTIAGIESSPHITGRTRLGFRRHAVGPLILAPTRELAIQIASDAHKLTTRQGGLEVQLLVGGNGKVHQMKDWTELSRDLVIATPGRLRDLLANEPEFRLEFKRCPMLILAETDTLLSMGFRDDIDAIASFLPQPPLRQTLLFSATMSRAVRQLASWILSPNHTFVNTTQPEFDLTPSQSEERPAYTKSATSCDGELSTPVEQFRLLCSTASDQLPTLLKLLAHDQLTHGQRSKAIVFCPTAQMAELLVRLLRSLAEQVLPDKNTEIMKMHLRMKRSDRDRVRKLFHGAGKTQDGRPTVLVISDISGRAANYPGLTRMIHMGVPNRETAYIHQIRSIARGANISLPGHERENGDKPTVRADLLLLPWEAGYMDWQLTTLGIKPLPISVLDDQLASLSPRSTTLSIESLQSILTEIRSHVDSAEVRSIAASLLGYYLPLSPPLRLQPHAVLAGVSSWASECFHVTIPRITRFPKKFTDAYEQSMRPGKTKGLFVDGLRLASPSPLGKAKSKNRSVWEGADTRKKKPKRWY